MDPYNINTRASGATGRDPQIESRKTERTSQFLAMDDMAADLERASQQVFGTRQITQGQRGAHLGAGDALAASIGHVGQRHDFETVRGAGLAQQRQIAAALASKPKVFADQQPACLQRIDKQVFDKGVSRHVCQPFIKALYDNLPHAVIGKGREFVTQARDAGGGELGALKPPCKIFAGMGLERHDRGQ